MQRIEVQRDVPVPMRDGVVLRADVYQPAVGDPLPVLVLRTPYDKRLAQTTALRHPEWYARRGYVVVVQDVRGRYASEGTFYPFRGEGRDGFDTIAWAATLPGTSGAVGTYGFSYPGMIQLLAAAERPPALRCCAVGFGGRDLFDGCFYKNGAFQWAMVLTWALEALVIPDAVRQGKLETAQRLRSFARTRELIHGAPRRVIDVLSEEGVGEYVCDWLEHDVRDEYWSELSLGEDRFRSIEVPCLHVGGWYDTFIDATIANHATLALRPRSAAYAEQSLLVGPWYHCPWGRIVGATDFGAGADNSVDAAQVRWFERWIGRRDPEGASPAIEPASRYFVLGRNVWRSADEWPPATAREEWFLHSAGGACSLGGDGTLSKEPPRDEEPDVYCYDPTAPVPSLGGASCCDPLVTPMGSYDQRPLEMRTDVLVYSSDVLEESIEIAGAVELTLFASTDAVDTDWTAKLIDVDQEDRAWNLCDSVVRARFRDGSTGPKELAPRTVYEYGVILGSTAAVFEQGHRIRLEVSSSNFPHYDANPNTGARLRDRPEFGAVVASQGVFHDACRPSRLVLPVRNAGPSPGA